MSDSSHRAAALPDQEDVPDRSEAPVETHVSGGSPETIDDEGVRVQIRFTVDPLSAQDTNTRQSTSDDHPPLRTDDDQPTDAPHRQSPDDGIRIISEDPQDITGIRQDSSQGYLRRRRSDRVPHDVRPVEERDVDSARPSAPGRHAAYVHPARSSSGYRFPPMGATRQDDLYSGVRWHRDPWQPQPYVLPYGGPPIPPPPPPNIRYGQSTGIGLGPAPPVVSYIQPPGLVPGPPMAPNTHHVPGPTPPGVPYVRAPYIYPYDRPPIPWHGQPMGAPPGPPPFHPMFQCPGYAQPSAPYLVPSGAWPPPSLPYPPPVPGPINPTPIMVQRPAGSRSSSPQYAMGEPEALPHEPSRGTRARRSSAGANDPNAFYPANPMPSFNAPDAYYPSFQTPLVLDEEPYVAVDPFRARRRANSLLGEQPLPPSLPVPPQDYPSFPYGGQYYYGHSHPLHGPSYTVYPTNGTTRALYLYLFDAPRYVYLVLLLFLPRLYWSRVKRIIEGVGLVQGEVVSLWTNPPEEWMLVEVQGDLLPFASSWYGRSPKLKAFKRSWEEFIDSLLTEWQTLNIVSPLMLSAILTLFQVQGAGDDPVIRTLLTVSLIGALMSLLYGCIYLARFGTMKSMHKAYIWAIEGKRQETGIFWNSWIFLALPSIWLGWSLLLFATSILFYVWRTGSTRDQSARSALQPKAALAVRIVISGIFGLGIMCLFLIVHTLGRYGSRVDKEWKGRIERWRRRSSNLPRPGWGSY